MDMDKTALGTMDTGEATQMMSAPAGNATQMAMNIQCPVCRTPNPPSETYCIDCGFLLSSAPAEAVEMPEAPSVGKLVAPDGTREFPLNAGVNTVGRENADVLLTHNTVSRKHASVSVLDGKVLVEDCGSTNGTYVDGKKLGPDEKAELKDGSDVVFGSFSLKYQAPAEAESGEQSGEKQEADAADEKTEMIAAPEEKTETIEPAAEPTVGEPEFDLEGATEPASEAAAVAEPTAEEAVEPAAAPAAVGWLAAKDGSCRLEIHAGTNTVGRRAEDNDIDIADPYCSGRHADLTFEGGKFTVTDVGSTNGTLVNGVKLEAHTPRELVNEDEVTLGRTAFVLEVA